MQTGLFPGRHFPQFVLPENDSATFAFWDPAFFSNPLVCRSSAAHGPIVGTGGTLVFEPAELVAHDACLHPDTGGVDY